MRDGGEWIGWGMATGIWEALQMPATVRIVLTANGHAEVASAASDIGTGTYTIMAQVAADMLGLALDNVSIKLGDSTLPPCPLEGGSWIAASVCNAILTTAGEVRKDLLGLAARIKDSPLVGATLDDVVLAEGKIVSKRDPSRAVSIADAMRCGNVDRITQEKANTFPDDKAHARNTHSAIFAEVKVDQQIGVIRVTRVVNAVAARAHPQPQDSPQPGDGQRGLGDRYGTARGNAFRSPIRPRHERQHRRIPRPGECRRA